MQEMKTIYLMRHCKSDWESDFKIDHERPLSERGKKNAKELRKFLVDRKIHFDISYISDSKRTIQTFEILKKEVHFSEVKISSKLYETNFTTLYDLIKQTDDKINSILLLGHNPELEEFANHLILRQNSNLEKSFFQKFPTSAFLSLSLNITHWELVSTTAAKINYFWIPTKS
jgi:phosphohistidine phosphatase